MEDSLIIKTALFDYGKRIGVAVEHGSKRRAFRFDNPFWSEMDKKTVEVSSNG